MCWLVYFKVSKDLSTSGFDFSHPTLQPDQWFVWLSVQIRALATVHTEAKKSMVSVRHLVLGPQLWLKDLVFEGWSGSEVSQSLLWIPHLTTTRVGLLYIQTKRTHTTDPLPPTHLFSISFYFVGFEFCVYLLSAVFKRGIFLFEI